MQARWGTHGDHPIIAISPSSVQEAYHATIRAFNLSERLRVPVILLMDEIVGHMREGVELLNADEVTVLDRLTEDDPAQAGIPYDVAPGEFAPHMTPFGQSAFYNITGLFHDGRGFPTSSPEMAGRQCTRIMEKIAASTAVERYEALHMEDAAVCVVSFGGTARSARAAVNAARGDGYRVGSFRPVTVWPFPEAALDGICNQVHDIIVAELNYGQMKLEVERVAAGRCRVHHIGRVNGTIIRPDEIYRAIQEVAG